MNDLNLPEGWCQTKLAEIADWGSGGTPSRKEAAYYEGDIPWVKTGDLGPKVLDSASEHISELAVKNSSAKYFPKGSVAIAMYGATIGKTSILGIDATTNQACGVGNPIDGLTFSEFLYYFLLNEKDNFIAKGKGGTQPNISQALIKEHEVALPPLAEQKVIADKLDTLLAQVDTTKARLERIPQILKTFRQSVLAAAVSGKLTEEWRGGVEYIEEKVIFGSLISSSSVGLVRSASEQHEDVSGRHPYIKMNNIDNFWGHNTNNIKFVDASSEELIKYGLEKNDWLFNTRNSVELVGKSCVWKGEDGIIYNNNILRVKFINSVLSDYIEIFIKSPKGQKLLSSIKSGTTNVAAIYQKQLFQTVIHIPNMEEQTEIVHRVGELFAFADAIEQKAAAALDRVNNLTQAILAKAFRGELTADWRAANPELIRGDNSAEALLKKIQAEREALSLSKKSRTRENSQPNKSPHA